MRASILVSTDERQTIMNNPGTEETLVRKAQEGDRAAFDELTSSAAVPLRARIRARLGPGLREVLDPEDVLQETFLRAFRALGAFRWQGEKSFERWLHGIALNCVLNAARECGKRPLLAISREPPAPGPTPSRAERREERFERLEAALARLRPEYGRVVRLARLEGLSIAEIAARMQRTPDSVRNLLFRAMQELRGSFGDTESLGLPDRSMEEGHER
jgi:RNA polymerase sigma-70 factor, ECF subfamily